MSVTGLCQICEQHVAEESCDRCGAAVCAFDYDGEMGFCADCAQQAKPDNRRGDTFTL
jgi:hypothetical protein